VEKAAGVNGGVNHIVKGQIQKKQYLPVHGEVDAPWRGRRL